MPFVNWIVLIAIRGPPAPPSPHSGLFIHTVITGLFTATCRASCPRSHSNVAGPISARSHSIVTADSLPPRPHDCSRGSYLGVAGTLPDTQHTVGISGSVGGRNEPTFFYLKHPCDHGKVRVGRLPPTELSGASSQSDSRA